MPTKEERAAEAKKHNGLVRGVFEIAGTSSPQVMSITRSALVCPF